MQDQSEMQGRMLRGEQYQADDPVLVAARRRCALALERFNTASAADEGARTDILRELLGGLGQGSVVMPPFRCDYGSNVHFGPGCFVNYGAVFLDVMPIRLGQDVFLGPNVQLLGATHPVDPVPRRALWESGAPITIGDGAWLGGGAIVLPGVTIGAEAIVGAGAVVTRDVAPRTIVAGNPARVIRVIGDEPRPTPG